MNFLIVYATRHGCAEEAAEKLQKELSGEVELINLKKSFPTDLTEFETVIIGGSIHAGQIQKVIKKFYRKNIEVLKQKRLGLYLCCMEEGETAQKQFDEAYPAELRDHATASGFFGGAFNFERMNFLEKAIVKKVAKVSESVSKIRDDNILQFASKIQG